MVSARQDLEVLYREHGSRLWWALVGFSGDRDIASDAESEAFAQALRRGEDQGPPRLDLESGVPDRGGGAPRARETGAAALRGLVRASRTCCGGDRRPATAAHAAAGGGRAPLLRRSTHPGDRRAPRDVLINGRSAPASRPEPPSRFVGRKRWLICGSSSEGSKRPSRPTCGRGSSRARERRDLRWTRTSDRGRVRGEPHRRGSRGADASLRLRRARLTARGEAGAPAPLEGISLRLVRPPPDRPGCFLCHRPTFDPDKREVPWARAVAAGMQVLICPDCQHDRPDWADNLDRCEACGGTRLSITLGQVVCRACGHTAKAGA